MSALEVLNLDIKDPIAVETAVFALGGSVSLYFNLLEKFEVVSLHKNMAKIVICLEKDNWQEMDALAYMLKMSSGIIGAGKVYYACYYMQGAFLQRDYGAMLRFYPLLVEAAVELKRYTRKFLADSQGRQICFSNCFQYLIGNHYTEL